MANGRRGRVKLVSGEVLSLPTNTKEEIIGEKYEKSKCPFSVGRTRMDGYSMLRDISILMG